MNRAERALVRAQHKRMRRALAAVRARYREGDATYAEVKRHADLERQLAGDVTQIPARQAEQRAESRGKVSDIAQRYRDACRELDVKRAEFRAGAISPPDNPISIFELRYAQCASIVRTWDAETQTTAPAGSGRLR